MIEDEESEWHEYFCPIDEVDPEKNWHEIKLSKLGFKSISVDEGQRIHCLIKA